LTALTAPPRAQCAFGRLSKRHSYASTTVGLDVYTIRYIKWCRWRLVEAEELFRAFYYSLGLPLRSVIEYKIRRRGGSPSEVFEKPWLLLHYVGLELGQHNAELVGMLFVDFARRHRVDPKVAAEALRNPEGWRKFAEYVRDL
jgi:hypothetical protein